MIRHGRARVWSPMSKNAVKGSAEESPQSKEITSATSQECVGDEGSAEGALITEKNETCTDVGRTDENTSGPTKE
jgi:hypothetical protein